jgi:hypothetical protein
VHAQRDRGALAPFLTVRAIDDDRPPRLELARPGLDRGRIALRRAGNELGIARHVGGACR